MAHSSIWEQGVNKNYIEIIQNIYENGTSTINTQILAHSSIQEQGVDKNFIEIIQNIYENGTSTIRLHKDTDEMKIAKGVRQGDTISLTENI